jgi:hypothetical protein
VTPEQLHKLFDENPTCDGLDFEEKCHDCGADVTVFVDLEDDGFRVSGGAVYWPEFTRKENGDPLYFLKCDACYGADPVLRKWRPCEVYDRVVGYLRPIGNMSKAKQAEQRDRARYNIDGI